ncbi:N-ATPase, AtpR subunit [Caballeronia arationis]|jgi:F1F0 ATPase subunit 2|uniref:F1/F0 ATPase, subunit 2 n=1 Tax=Caballeronia arationis TaxID=1777142 RepID=A0A7Z7I2Q1_9BURK|nr:ATP synthase subunit I [Caballeronia arationis]SAK99105.1 N-ATPase, AtpR subunit [Caballeronia arationis]SOE56455.1 F1/F0 ATPase, subunit 2 [Caballeronia arationis]
MIEHLAPAAQIPVGLIAGFVAGLIHFTTLHRNVELLAFGSPGKALAMQCARLGLLLVILFVLAKLGAWALLCGAAGLLVARSVKLRRYRAIAP